MFATPAATRPESVKSIILYLPPKGTDAIVRILVSSGIASSCELGKIIPKTLSFGAILFFLLDIIVNHTIHVGNDYYYPHLPLDKHIALMAEALDEILPVAGDNRITVCIENIWCRSNTPEKLLEIKAAFPCDTLGFCFDAGHANQMDKGRNFEKNSAADCYVLVGETPVYDDQIQEKMLPHIVNCHLNDNDGQYDTHINLFDGNTDWGKVIRLLRQAPRLKCIQSEVVPVANKTSIRDICEAFRKLGELY